jgi:NitT/TauT family transport system substrate-binding protein
MSGQIDVGWAAAPFGVEAIEQGKIRVIARASDVAAYRTQTSRVLAANLAALDRRRDVFVRYMRAYRDGLDWLYSDPSALTAYAAWAGTTERIARRLRDEFLPKADIDPSNISGLPELMAQAVTFRLAQSVPRSPRLRARCTTQVHQHPQAYRRSAASRSFTNRAPARLAPPRA